MTDAVAAVRAALADHVAALHAGDAERVVAGYAPDIVAFEMVPPLALRGAAVRDVAATRAWLESWGGTLSVEVRELEVTASGDVGFACAFHRMQGNRAGRAVDLWLRSTICLRRIGDVWRIAHAHSSVPMRPDQEMRAALDLVPE